MNSHRFIYKFQNYSLLKALDIMRSENTCSTHIDDFELDQIKSPYDFFAKICMILYPILIIAALTHQMIIGRNEEWDIFSNVGLTLGISLPFIALSLTYKGYTKKRVKFFKWLNNEDKSKFELYVKYDFKKHVVREVIKFSKILAMRTYLGLMQMI